MSFTPLVAGQYVAEGSYTPYSTTATPITTVFSVSPGPLALPKTTWASGSTAQTQATAGSTRCAHPGRPAHDARPG